MSYSANVKVIVPTPSVVAIESLLNNGAEGLNQDGDVSELNYGWTKDHAIEKMTELLVAHKHPATIIVENVNDSEVADYEIEIFEKDGVFTHKTISLPEKERIQVLNEVLAKVEQGASVEELKAWIHSELAKY